MPKIILTALLLLFTQPGWAAKKMETLLDQPLAKDLAFPDLQGQLHHISDYRGKVVVVNYFASWCDPCRAEIPSLNKAWSKVKDGNVVMLAISAKESKDNVRQFLKQQPIDFQVLLDEKGKIFEDWPVKGIPTTLVIDKEGHFTYRALGEREWDSNTLLWPIFMLELGKLVD